MAHRVVVKEEDNFGAKMVTFADEKAPGVAVAYMFFDDEAAEYVTWTFDSKSLYEKSKVGDFLSGMLQLQEKILMMSLSTAL